MTDYISSNFNEADVAKIYIAVNPYGLIKQYFVNSKGYTIKEQTTSDDEIRSLYGNEKYDEMISLKGKAFNQVKVKG